MAANVTTRQNESKYEPVVYRITPTFQGPLRLNSLEVSCNLTALAMIVDTIDDAQISDNYRRSILTESGYSRFSYAVPDYGMLEVTLEVIYRRLPGRDGQEALLTIEQVKRVPKLLTGRNLVKRVHEAAKELPQGSKPESAASIAFKKIGRYLHVTQ